MSTVYVVEVIRMGDPELGVQFFGVFDDLDVIHKTMANYNVRRGGKYPAYYVIESELNPSKMQGGLKNVYEVDPSLVDDE